MQPHLDWTRFPTEAPRFILGQQSRFPLDLSKQLNISQKISSRRPRTYQCYLQYDHTISVKIFQCNSNELLRMFNLDCENQSSVANGMEKKVSKVSQNRKFVKVSTLEDLPQNGLSTHNFLLPHYLHSLLPQQKKEESHPIGFEDNNHYYTVLTAVATEELDSLPNVT